MRLVLLREIPEDEQLREQWNALVMRLDQPQIFYTFEWALAVQRAYGAVLRPLVFLSYEGETLTGVVALARETVTGAVSFLCATTGDYCDFLSAPDTNAAFISAVVDELRKQKLGEVTLANLPADSQTVATLREASRESGYHLFARTAYQCAQISMAPFRETEGKAPPLPGTKKLKRCLHTLAREMNVRFDHACSWSAVESILPEFTQTHVGRFLLTGRISNLAARERRVFLAELARLLSTRGWLALTRMVAGDRAIAWNYGFRFAGSWFWYQPTFDSEFERYSPGTCLLAQIVQEAAHNPGMHTVDLGLGAEEYKEIFANRARRTLYVTLRASVGLHVGEMIRYASASAIKTSPKLENRVRALVAATERLKEKLGRKGLRRLCGQFTERCIDSLWSDTEVIFFESAGEALENHTGRRLQKLSLRELASAVSQYSNDPETCAYLLRSAARLKRKSAEGFVLVDSNESLLHFAWVTEFQDFFLSELNAKVNAPAENCRMLFDCWTPAAARGHGYYGKTIAMMAKRVHDAGGKPWIFSAATNAPSIRGLQKAGFQRRYSLVRQVRMNLQSIRMKTGLARLDGSVTSQHRSHVA